MTVRAGVGIEVSVGGSTRFSLVKIRSLSEYETEEKNSTPEHEGRRPIDAKSRKDHLVVPECTLKQYAQRFRLPTMHSVYSGGCLHQ